MQTELDDYHLAQRAVADLKTAVLRYLEQQDDGATNATIGRALGIYFGHKGHVGHVSRALLDLLEHEGLVEQDPNSKVWTAT